MEKPKYITVIQLHNIKAVRGIRLELGVAGIVLSTGIGKVKTFIGVHESKNGDSYYSDTDMTNMAIVLTEEAESYQAELIKKGDKRKIKTKFTILDFYPKTPLTDEKVPRYFEPIPNDSGPAGTLNAIIEETDFYSTHKTLTQTVIYCNEIQNQSWTSSDFTDPLDRAVKKRRLKVKTLEGGLNGYYKPKETK